MQEYASADQGQIEGEAATLISKKSKEDKSYDDFLDNQDDQ